MNALLTVFVLLLLSAIGTTQAQTAAPEPAPEEAVSAPHTAPVVVDGVALFPVIGVSAYPAEARAQAIADRIREVAANRAYSAQSLTTQEGPLGSEILIDNHRIMTVLDADARIEDAPRPVLAHAYTLRIGEAISDFRSDREPKLLTRHAIYASVAVLALILGLWVARRIVTKLRSKLETRYREKIQGVRIQKFHLIHPEHIWQVLTVLLRTIWIVGALSITYLSAHYILSLFPWTRGVANNMSAIVRNPLITIATSFLNAIPNLVFLVIIVVVTWYGLKLVRLFFVAVDTGAITLSGFEAEWAKPTYRLVRVALMALALVAAYPYIPGSNSQAFKGVSLLIGLIFSLGSSSLIGNMISGYSMAYRRVFKPGDRIRIGDHIGDVEESRLMVTYLRTVKNELIAVPNSEIINSTVVNYSTLAQTDGLILHTTVGIGYERSWRQVEAMLLEAAARTPGLLSEPKPFVLQKQLGEFMITYEINAYCDNPRAMGRLYAALHASILDVFNEYGVQIMTPAYEGDPDQAKIVPKEQWYTAPASPPDKAAGAG